MRQLDPTWSGCILMQRAPRARHVIEGKCRWHILDRQVSMKEATTDDEGTLCGMSTQYEIQGARQGDGTQLSCSNVSKHMEGEGSHIRCYFHE
jgi:hypothetical protein